MPSPARTSVPEIVAVGREILARDGLDGLTMAEVAARVGVRAPSLYKRVSGRSELVRLVAEDVVAELHRELEAAARTGDPATDLRALADALRSFAHRDPHGHGLLFLPMPDEMAPDPELVAAAAAPVLRVCEELVGPDEALNAARTVTAWASGFLRMELSGGFQLGGSVDEAFAFGVGLLARALAGVGPDLPGSRDEQAPQA